MPVLPPVRSDGTSDAGEGAIMSDTALSRRKDDHLDIVRAQRTAPATGAGGGEYIHFEHCALPELDLTQIDLRASLLGKTMRAPLLISSITGGMQRAEAINQHLSEAAQALGIAMCVGSQRVSLQSRSFQGLTGVLRRLARRLGADRSRRLSVPIVAKEVGSGLSASVGCSLVEAGVAVIDVAGAGGTSWAAVEGERARGSADRAVAMAFADWGIPTPASVTVRRALPGVKLIASGGIRDGVDVAKALWRGHRRAGGRRSGRGDGVHRGGYRALRDRHPPIGRRVLLHRLG